MARRRMIDPNFWQSEDVSKLTIRQRLLLVGLFSNADDEGRLRGTPAYIRSAVFPYEDFTLLEIEDDLNAVESIGSIRQYLVESSKYIQLINWFKFQRVDKPQKSVIPQPILDEENHSKNESKNDSVPKEVKGKEDSIGEEKGREEEPKKIIVPVFDNPLNSNIEAWFKKYNVEYGIKMLEDVCSYVGVVEIEVIEHCIGLSENKTADYTMKIINRHVREGKTKFEHIKPKGVTPFERTDQGSAGIHGKSSTPLTDLFAISS